MKYLTVKQLFSLCFADSFLNYAFHFKFNSMKYSLCILFFICTSMAYSQDRTLPAESAVNSTGQVTIKGKVVPYKATAGTQPVWDKDGKVIASLFYTYYERSDVTEKS